METYQPWNIQLEHWNTGRVYFAKDWGQEFAYGQYGGVCSGTGSRAIRGRNGKNFGQFVCAALGLSKALFVGYKSEYARFMEQQSIPLPAAWNDTCIPSFNLAGAECHKKQCKRCDKTCRSDEVNCNWFDFEYHGGTCLRGSSDVYVHCDAAGDRSAGQWSEWRDADEGECKSEKDFFRQQYRKCESDHHTHPFCKGSWLKVGNKNI